MKKLVYLLVIGAAGYFLFPYIEPLIFNFLPQEIRRKVFSVEVPKSFRGRYAEDLKVNENWKWQYGLNLHSKAIMAASNQRVMELKAVEMRFPVMDRVDAAKVELVAKGKNYIVLEYYDHRMKQMNRRRLERDDGGVWVIYEEPRQTRQRYFRPI